MSEQTPANLFPEDSAPGAAPTAAPPARTGPNLGQRLARLSWWSCFLAIVLNFVVALLAEPYPSLAGAAVYGIIALIAAALLLAIVALAGISKWGREDVVRPALVGLVLSLAMIGLMGNQQISQRKLAERNAQIAAEQRRQFEQQTREVLMASGWLGTREVDGAIVTLASVPQESETFRAIRGKLNADVSLGLVLVRNIGSKEASVDTGGANILLADGQQQPALEAGQVLAQADREQMMQALEQPLRVPAGSGASTLVFFPAATDWLSVRGASLKINGVDQTIHGAYLTSEQKAALYRAATQAATRAATRPE